jgi:2-polyprenyl-3-methyl-5-hydroxy-6-metoxy-1,4-benzoquinol methylase
MVQPKKRLLVFAPTYPADGFREGLRWIPRELEAGFALGIAVVDPGAGGLALSGARERAGSDREIIVLHNQYDPGCGGDQKIAYAYAIAEEFDFVAMLPGDGSCGPAELPRLLEPLLAGEADAVLGLPEARGLHPSGVIRKLGRRVLGIAATETACRLFSVEALRKVPFRLNANDDSFDINLLTQFLEAGLRIAEIPVSAKAHRSPLQSARFLRKAARTKAQHRIHRMGLFYQRRFDTTPSNLQYDLKLGYASSHSYALDAVPRGASVLDIGSGPGGMARELLAKGCDVAVVDQFAPEEGDPRIAVFTQDLEQPPRFDVNRYQYLLMLDVIEHMKDPERCLDELRSRFDDRPKTLVLTTPNIAFVVQRVMLALGQFNYGKTGILDRTHTRLFTFRTLERLLRDAGFRIKTIRGVPAPFPKVLGNGVLGRTAVAVNTALIGVAKTLFSYQIYVEAETTPDTDFVLRENVREQSSFREASSDAVPAGGGPSVPSPRSCPSS